jgi:hypothetical protein
MNLCLATYYTARKVKNSFFNTKDSFKDKNDVTTDTSNDSEPDFDSLDDDAFDLILSADFDLADDFINVN